MKLKKATIFIPVLIGVLIISTFSCTKYLEKPLVGSDIIEDSVFASRLRAESFLAETYKHLLPFGFPYFAGDRTFRMRRSIQASLCDEADFSIGASEGSRINVSGFVPNNVELMNDVFAKNWDGIRRAYIFIENIDNVPDIAQNEKEQMKAECKAMIALRYSHMLKHYGGVPIVTKRLNSEDDVNIPRASVAEVVDFIVQLCDEAASILPNSYSTQWHGRVTKGVALATKARTLLFAASPLFNTNNPVLPFEEPELIAYPSFDLNRWRIAADANKDVLDWALANGCHLIESGNPFDDFGKAVSQPDNAEIILAYKGRANQNGFTQFYLPNLGGFNEGNGIPLNFLKNFFYKADGSDQDWPTLGDDPLPFSDYLEKMEQMEPRFKQSAWVYGRSPHNNSNNPRFIWDFNAVDGYNHGYTHTAKLLKFVYNYQGTNANYGQDWIIYRLAEFYLNYAEALNEFQANNPEAYGALNAIRKRAGLPLIATDDPLYSGQEALRQLIRRERAVELYAEEHRPYDVRRWRIAHEPGVVGGDIYSFRYTRNESRTAYTDYSVYHVENRFWQNKMYFTCFPQAEVNKGYLLQNPGY